MKKENLLIGEVARKAGVRPKTIRFYEEISLLPEPERSELNNYRIYSNETVNRLKYIKKSQKLGFSLKEIGEILAFKDKDLKPCNHVRNLLRQKLDEIEKSIAELRNLHKELKKVEEEWEGSGIDFEAESDGSYCPQIEKINLKE